MVNEKRTLLAVLAHPDDESFGTGGTLALYAQRGIQVHLVCATRGEAGEVSPEHLNGYSSVAELREAELRCAASKLGLANVHFLDYRDSGMNGSVHNRHPQALIAQPVEQVSARVAHYIRLLQPQVVVTFDPIGGYRHPDHIAIHKATVRAYELAADPAFNDDLPPYQPAKLYYHIIPRGLLRLAVGLMPLFGHNPRRLGRNGDIDLVSLIADGNFPAHVRVNYGPVESLKDAASLCHASQLEGGSLRSGPMRWARLLFGHKDYFTRAAPPAGKGLREDDLFAGL